MRTCLFCDQKATTSEHLLSEWILDLLGSSFSAEAWLGKNRERRTWRGRGPSAQLKVKWLCDGCNNGWMSDLETKVRYLLGPLIHDLSIPLDRSAQQLIATWCVKTSMVTEAVGPPQGWFYTRAEREHLRATLSLPTGSFVWLGRCKTSDLSYCDGRKLFGANQEGFVVTLVAARLILQTLTVRPTRSFTEEMTRRNPLIQVWPPSRPHSWPPPVSLDEQQLDALARRFTKP
jgi:hypothetical protein